MNSPWLVTFRPVGSPRARVVCFPNAGAAASIYFRWPGLFPSDVEVVAVQPPGRATRHREPVPSSLEPVLAALDEAFSGLWATPTIAFGHSLGATIAWEWTRHRRSLARASGAPAPVGLVVSARQAPHVPRRAPDICGLPDRVFLEQLVAHYDAPRVLLASADLAQLALPALRGDFALVEGHRCVAGPPLDVPLAVIAGRTDPLTRPEDVDSWRDHAHDVVETVWVDAGHNFLDAHAVTVASVVARMVHRVVPPT
jgi:medium-chain acyl-[acyl-carrier-protein] hydrolase